MEASFLNLGGSAWDTLLDHTKDAIVFVDSKAGESLHWSLGVDSLLTRGSLGVKELNAFKVHHSTMCFDVLVSSKLTKPIFLLPVCTRTQR